MPPFTRRHLLTNFSWLMSERIVNTAVMFVVSVYVTRYLGPADFGVLSYAQSLIFLVTALSTLGLDDVLIRELVRDEQKANTLLGTAFWMRALGSLVGAGAIIGYTLLDDKYQQTTVLVAILSVGLLFESFGVIDRYFYSRIEAKQVIRFRVFSFLATSVVRVSLVLVNADLVYFAWAIALNGAFKAIAYVFAYTQMNNSLAAWRWRPSTAKRLLATSWPVLFAGLAVNLQARIDQVMLASMVDAASVGYYSLALRLTELLGVVAVGIGATLAPFITRAHTQGREEFLRRMEQTYRIMFATALGIGIPVFFLGEVAVALVYGDAFHTAGRLFSLFSLRLVILHLGIARQAYILNEDLLRFAMITMIVATLINVVGNYLLIPRYHEFGAYYASLISFGSLFLLDGMNPAARGNLAALARGGLRFWDLGFALNGLWSKKVQRPKDD